MAAAGGSGEDKVKLRVFFIPFFAASHIIPMFDLARLMAAGPSVESTMLLTPANAGLVRPSPDCPVHLLLYPFPSAAVGLPDGHENLSSVPSDDAWKVEKAVVISRETLDPIIRDHRPDAIVSDFLFYWAVHTASNLGIPCVTCSAIGAFSKTVVVSLAKHRTHESAVADDQPFTVAGLPGPAVELVRSEIPLFLRSPDTEVFTGIYKNAMEAQKLCFGAVINTFYELEADYCDLYRRTICSRMWFVGPVAGERGGAVDDGDRCLRWLESQRPHSVVFVCFGSWCHFAEEQLQELAVGLEASGQPFLWVMREGGGKAEERVGDRGLVVRGWAPQVAILNHPAVGAFMTHCGWNSVLEAVAAGVPMLTWPLVFDHFIIERLVLVVLGTGARVWHGSRSVAEAEKVVVPGAAIGRAVAEFMEAGGPGEEARRRALEYAAMAKAAVAEGGSSYKDLDGMIDELKAATGRSGVDEQ